MATPDHDIVIMFGYSFNQTGDDNLKARLCERYLI